MTANDHGDRPDDGTPEVLPEAEARIAALLRASADVGPMPDDVVARLDAALAEADVATPVASLDSRRRSRVRRFQRVFATAAGIAVVAVGGGIAYVAGGLPGTHQTGSSSDSSAVAEDLPATARLLQSGKDFVDVASVRDVAQDVVADSTDAVGESQPTELSREAAPTEGTSGGGIDLLNAPAEDPLPDGDAATSAEDQRPVAERVVGCAGIDPESVVAIEIATWKSEPAALVVHRTDGGAEALMVALDCASESDVLSRVDVPAP